MNSTVARLRTATTTTMSSRATRVAVALCLGAASVVVAGSASAQSAGASFSTTGTAPSLRGRAPLPDPRRPPATNEDEELLRRNYWFYRAVTAARLNPLGLFADLRFSYRSRLYQNIDTIFRESFVAFSPSVVLSPAWARVGAFAEIQPLALLNLSAGAEFIGMLGTFDTVQSWDSPQARASDYSQDGGTPARYSYRTAGFQFTLGALFQVRLANSFVLRSNARFFYSQLNTRVPDATERMNPGMDSDAMRAATVSNRRGTNVWYDILNDTLLPSRGWNVHIDSDLLFSPEGAGLTLGVRHSFTQVFWGQTDFQPTDFCNNGMGGIGGRGMAPTLDSLGGCGAAGFFDPNGPMHRIGPLIAYNFKESYHARFNAPTVFVAVQWWLAHRYRTGDRTNAQEMMLGNPTSPSDFTASAFPYIAIGFSFRGDLLFPRR
jgi:hypothetical protein